jgi:hypothetical protein
MKKALFVLLILSVLIVGCSGGETAEKPAKTSKYAGFMEWKAGMWSETVSKQGSQTVTMRTELIENSPTLAKFQMSTETGGQESVMQVWMNPSTQKASKYVMKTGDQVLCMNIKDVQGSTVPTKGDSYNADMPGWAPGTYTTPSGKTLVVAKFSQAAGEYWVSSQVPFGMVKVVQGGKTVLSLNDYGTIGAQSKISDEEIAGCTDMSKLASTYSAPVREAPAEEEAAEPAAEEPSEAPDYEAEATKWNTDERATIGCDACNGMPPAAKAACLAACG